MFIGCLVALSAFYGVFLTETNQLSLESIAGAFGDETVAVDKVVAHAQKGEEKRGLEGEKV